MQRKLWIYIGVFAALCVCMGEFFTDTWLATLYPEYDWMKQSISYMGQEGSPVVFHVAVWGVLFTLFFLLFAVGFFQAFGGKNKWVILASAMIGIYGLGEGIGSGFFPINPEGTTYTSSAFYHDLFGGIGDVGLVGAPLVMMKVFPNQKYFNFFKWVTIVGISLALLFVFARYFNIETGIFSYRGIWQRLYLLNYNIFLLAIAWMMWRSRNNNYLILESTHPIQK